MVGGVVLLSAASSGFLFPSGDPSFSPAAVESMESEFGEVSRAESAIETRVVVDNPNEREFPVPATVRHTIYLRSIPLARGATGAEADGQENGSSSPPRVGGQSAATRTRPVDAVSRADTARPHRST